MAQKIPILAQKWLKFDARKTNRFFFGNSLLMGLGQDQQQHLAVHTGRVSRGRVHGCGCCVRDMWQVTGDMQYKKLFFKWGEIGFVPVLLSAHVKRFNASSMQDFSCRMSQDYTDQFLGFVSLCRVSRLNKLASPAVYDWHWYLQIGCSQPVRYAHTTEWLLEKGQRTKQKSQEGTRSFESWTFVTKFEAWNTFFYV